MGYIRFFQEKSKGPVPLYIFVYGGPGSQTVTERYRKRFQNHKEFLAALVALHLTPISE